LKDFNIIPKRLVQFYSKVINARWLKYFHIS
jgi:hypothetical protein